MKKNILKIGDDVLSEYGPAKITKIELCEKVGDKYGIEVNSVHTNLVDRIVVDLDNGHWNYGTQLDWIPY